MAVIFHPREGDIDIAAALHERRKLRVQILRIAPEVVIRVRANDRIEELPLKRHRRRVRLHGDYLPVTQPHPPEESAVFVRIAPKVSGVDREAVLLRHEHRGQPRPAPKVADHCARRYAASAQQLLLKLHRIRPHYQRLKLRRVVFFTQYVFHACFS